MNEESFTISQLNSLIKDVVNAGFPQALWLCGEIQGFDRNRERNHIFFDLVEKDAVSHEVVAKVGLVIFANRKSSLLDVLKKSGDPFSLKDDIEVRFQCRVDFYPPHGAVRLVVENVDPIYTLGKIAREKQRLIAFLKEKGVLEQNKTTVLSAVPLNIGLITAFDSAAYNDFISELRKSGFGFNVFVRSSVMQGKKTENDVSRALKELNKIPDLDCVVITRGGGSISDLSWFDSQKIAETIARYPIPVLSGIGHEINITITDMAAHTYAKTPTAIAQFVVGRVQESMSSLEEKLWVLLELAESEMMDERQKLKMAAMNLQNGTLRYLRDHKEKMIRFKEILRQRPTLLIKDSARALNEATIVFKKNLRLRLERDKSLLWNYQKMISLLHPEHALKRGFSITRKKDGCTLKSIADVKPDEELITQLADGTFASQVKEGKKFNKEEELDLFEKKK